MTRSQAAQILGVSPQANEDAIKKAFRKKAMKLHPDKNKSPNARSQFIEAHEAYEYLIDLATGRKTEAYSRAKSSSSSANASKFRSPNHKHRHYADPYENMSREEFEERYNRAKRAAEENLNRRSQAIHANALEEYQTTWRKPLAKAMAVLGIILAILFTTDFYLGTITEQIPEKEAEIMIIKDSQYHYYYLNIHHVKYSLDNKVRYFIKQNKVKYIIERTQIFKDIINVTISTNKRSVTLQPTYSSYQSFPLIPLILLLPLLSFWFEGPSFNFVFFAVYFNIYVFPIFTLILLFHDGRLLRLFGF